MYLYIVSERSHGLDTTKVEGNLVTFDGAVGQLKFFFSAIYARMEAQSDGGSVQSIRCVVFGTQKWSFSV